MPTAPLRLALAATLCCATNLSAAAERSSRDEPEAAEAAAPAAPAALAPAPLVWPSWGWDITRAPGVASRTECFTATDDGGSAEEATGFPQPHWHNLSGPAPLQWVHWAAPAGPVPPTGFPIFVMFEVEGWLPPNGTCGNPGGRPPPPPPPPAKCLALLEQTCGLMLNNWTACHQCEAEARVAAMREGLNCSVGVYPSGKFKGKPRNWIPKEFCGCSKGVGDKFVPCQTRHSWPVTYGPFSTPDESISWAFMRNGSLNQSVASSESPEADFPQAGLMWIQRIKQLLLANGVGVVILNPLVADGWDWDTLQDWNNGTDRPYLHKLFTAMAGGSFPAGMDGRRLFDTNRVVPAGYSVGAQSTCSATHVSRYHVITSSSAPRPSLSWCACGSYCG